MDSIGTIVTIGSGIVTWICAYVLFSTGARTRRTGHKVFRATTWAVIVALSVAVGFWLDRTLGTSKRSASSIHGGAESSSPSFIEEEPVVKASLKEAMLFELLAVYVHPEEFSTKYEKLLPNYWVPAEEGGQDIRTVTAAVSNLLNHGWRYSTNAALKRFEFRSVQISGDFAHVETREFWYLPIIDREGLLVPKRAFPHYWEAGYDLLKMNGRWLILKSSAPYVKPDSSK